MVPTCAACRLLTLMAGIPVDEVITVNHAGAVVDAIGTIGVAGATTGELNGPTMQK